MNNHGAITRRNFLKWSGASALALTALPAFDQAALVGFLGSEKEANQVGILVDTTKCIGCRQCQMACQTRNNLPALPEKMVPNQTYPEQLSATALTNVQFFQTGGTAEAPVFSTIKRQCMHCLEPACAAVCPVAAIVKTPLGPVTYDAEKCLGCRYCMAACPFNIPKFEWDSPNPQIRKCTMCADRIADGQLPACVEACPTGALQFGPRRELIAEAQARIIEKPANYLPYIYGLTEVGGTSVMYLANVPFEQLGLNTHLPTSAMPELTLQVMDKVPAVAIGVALLAGGVTWWRGRKNRGNQAENDKSSSDTEH